jgi:hypothetical protein
MPLFFAKKILPHKLGNLWGRIFCFWLGLFYETVKSKSRIV